VRRRADAGVELAVDRAESWWRGRVFGSESYAYLWEREGEPRAYLVYEFEDGPEGRVLDVAEHAAVDHEAYLNLLRFCHDHDSQVATVRLRERATADLLELVADPGAVDYGVSAGPMLRVVDVLAALGALNYPEGVSTSLTLAVDDDLAPWNDDTFRLAVEDGRGTVERTDATPRVRTDVATLSQVLAGHHSVSKAHRFGVLEGEGDATDALADLFPPRPVFLRERF
jgi:predicted acetyltransferase